MDNNSPDKPTNSLDGKMPTRDTPEVNGDKSTAYQSGDQVAEAKCCSLTT